jgi:hypothetical protein
VYLNLKLLATTLRNHEKALTSIRALLVAEGIDFYDTPAVLESLSETVLPTALTRIYLDALRGATTGE